MDGTMTQRLFLDDPTLASTTATVIASGPEGIVLDRTVFYARGGGQPGDTGILRWDGDETPITEAVKGEGEAIRHLPAPDATLPAVGSSVTAEIDWQRRHAHMRMHTAMHLLCSLIKGAAVTGGSVGADKSRLDFDLPNPPPKGGNRGRPERPDRRRSSRPDRVGRRIRPRHRSRPGPHHVGAAATRHRAAPPDAHRRGRDAGRSATLRRHPCRAHRGNRSHPRVEDREQRQAEPPYHHSPRRLNRINPKHSATRFSSRTAVPI
jgi:hypothetical protein